MQPSTERSPERIKYLREYQKATRHQCPVPGCEVMIERRSKLCRTHASLKRDHGDISIEELATKQAEEKHWRTSKLNVWASKVKRRDGNVCRMCNAAGNLHAHHVARKVHYPALQYDVSNGITLCQPCHMEVHRDNELAAYTALLLAA